MSTAEQITARELRQEFLQKARPLLDQYINAAVHGKKLKSVDGDCREAVWDTLQRAILAENDVHKVRVRQQGDVLKLIEKGKVSIQDGLQLMQVLRAGSEMEELQRISEQLETLAAK